MGVFAPEVGILFGVLGRVFFGTGGGSVDVYDSGGGGLGGVIPRSEPHESLREYPFGGDGLGGVLLFSRSLFGLAAKISFPVLGEEAADVLRGREGDLNILYTWCLCCGCF